MSLFFLNLERQVKKIKKIGTNSLCLGLVCIFQGEGPKKFVHYWLEKMHTTPSPCDLCVYSSATVVKHLLCNVQILDFYLPVLKNDACMAVPVQTVGNDVIISPLLFSGPVLKPPL